MPEVKNMKIKDIMSKEVAVLNEEDTIQKAAQLMKEHDIGSLPVCSQQKVVGIVTDRDITLRATAGGADTRKVRDVMSANPVLGNPDMDVHEAVSLMSKSQIRRLPIVENNNLVGIVALGDISVEPILEDNAQEALKNISQPNQDHM
jgi:CBS domain-containing protein